MKIDMPLKQKKTNLIGYLIQKFDSFSKYFIVIIFHILLPFFFTIICYIQLYGFKYSNQIPVICSVGRVFANGPGDQCSIPGQVIL